MTLPANFAMRPGETPRHYFRNVCIEFKKLVQATRNIDELEQAMQNFINTSKNMNWHPESSGVYRKDVGEKAAEKVWSEFKRYIESIRNGTNHVYQKDILQAIDDVEQLIEVNKVS